MALDDIDKCSRAYRESAAFKRASFHPPEEIWSIFAESDGFLDVIDYFRALRDALNIDQNLHGIEFYEVLKSKLTSWKCQSLWDLLNARLKHAEYKHENKRVANNLKCVVIGAGPIGLRSAIESLFLGCRTVVVEKRKGFTRNNVLHLWPFLLTDFRALGAKKFYGKFGSGCIEHINIKTLQTVLLKVALVLGVEVYSGVEFKDLIEPTDEHGWKATFAPDNHELSKFQFDIVIGADGKKNVLPGFTQVELRGSLAIGITCNFINRNTEEEKNCKEISGISYQFKPTFFKDLKAQHGVELENIVYYKDETHYFVMTAVKASLLNQGVLLKDYSDPSLLVQPKNIDKERLKIYTCNAVRFATTLKELEFKKLSNGQSDIALFDFTSLKKAENACRIFERKKRKLLIGLVGDSLIEPFWPTGSGCGRGVLSALDLAWMVRQFSLNYPPLAVIRERENVFKLLSASTHDNIQKNYALYTIDPKTRYSALDTRKVQNASAIRALYDTDDIENADLTLSSPGLKSKYGRQHSTLERRKSNNAAGGSRAVRKTLAGKTRGKLHRQESRNTELRRIASKAEENRPVSVGDKRNFWEEHNKKSVGAGSVSMPKPKKTILSSGEFSDLEGIVEDVGEMEDNVIVESTESKKEKTVTLPKATQLKRQGSREVLETHPKSKLKRQPTKDLLKRQSTKEGKKSKSKSLKRQASKDDLESSSHSLNTSSTNKKKVFQAKGGGLKSRKQSEKQDQNKQKRKSTSDKKSSSCVKKKNRRSVEVEEAQVEDEKPRVNPVDAKSFFTSWLDKLLPKLRKEKADDPSTYEKTLETAAQASVISVMAMSLLYDCNKVPRRRVTDLKLKELIAKNDANFLKNSTTSNNKTVPTERKISIGNNGNVRNSVQKYRMLLEKEGQKNNDYYEFVKRPRVEKNTEREKEDIVDHVNREQSEKMQLLPAENDVAEFSPKDVIDVEEALLADEEREKKRSPVTKMTSFGGSTSDDEITLQLALEHFSNLQSPRNAVLMLQVLYNIHKRILDEPDKDKHYRIYTKSKLFEKYVWKWEGAESYFSYVGWMKCGDFLILSKSHPIHLTVKVIEEVFKKNKRVHLLYSGSEQSPTSLRNDEEIRCSEANGNEDDLYTTYTDIEVPTERDSAIGSGMEEEDEIDFKSVGKKTIHRLQSKEHNLGDEEYIVVDFIKDAHDEGEVVPEKKMVDVSSEKPTHAGNNDDSEIPVDNSSPYVSVYLPDDMKTQSPDFNDVKRKLAECLDDEEPCSENLTATPHGANLVSTGDISDISTEVSSSNGQKNDIILVASIDTENKIDEVGKQTEDRDHKSEINTVVDDTNKPAVESKPPEQISSLEDLSNMKQIVNEGKSLNAVNKVEKTDDQFMNEKSCLNEKNLPEKGTNDRKKKRKVFAAGRGLKGAKKSNKKPAVAQENIINPTKTDDKKDDTEPAVTLNNEKSDSPKVVNDPLRRSLPKVTPGSEFKRRSVDLDRSSSLKSLTKDKENSMSSIVMQNKLLFDQQIADGLKKKYPSSQDMRVPFAGTGQVDITAFEKNRPATGSFQDKTSSRVSCEIDLKGIVSGTRSLFEGGSAGNSNSSSGRFKGRNSSPNGSIRSNGSNTDSNKNIENNPKKELNKNAQTSGDNTSESFNEPFRSDIANVDAGKSAVSSAPENMDNNEPNLRGIPLLTSVDLGTNIKKKKKKFPFKKKKVKHVSHVGSTLLDGPYEERAIDVGCPHSLFAADRNGSEDPAASSNIVEESRKEDESSADVSSPVNSNSVTEKEMLHASEKREASEHANEKEISANKSIDVIESNSSNYINGSETTKLQSETPEVSIAASPSLEINGTESENERNQKNLLPDTEKSKKKKRLSIQKRKQKPLSDDETFSESQSTEDAVEEVVTEVVVADTHMSWSFDKLDNLNDECYLNGENENDDCRLNGENKDNEKYQSEESADVSLAMNAPVVINIDSLQNEISVDEDSVDESEQMESIVVEATANENDLSNISEECSDVTGSLYDTNSIAQSEDLNMSVGSESSDMKTKKKKVLPFRLKMGKKKKSKSQLGPPSPAVSLSDDTSINSSYKLTRKLRKPTDGSSAPSSPGSDVFRDDASSESSYKLSKKQKSKSRDNLLDLLPKRSTSSASSVATEDYSDQPQAYGDSSNLKMKSKKFPFFKKKKQSSSSSLATVSSSSDRIDDADSPTTLNGATVGYDSEVGKLHNETNGRMVYKDKLI